MTKGFSLHIGLNSVDPQHYVGWDGKLNACEADAEDMEIISKSLHYSNTYKLLTKDATIENVTTEIKKAASTLESGDIFFLTYSGHGGQIPDINNDESDNLDETWCLYDGQFLDDELYSLFSLFKEDVRIILLSDSCHSGTVVRASEYYGLRNETNININTNTAYRFIPIPIRRRTYEKNKEFYIKKSSLNNINEKRSQDLKCSIKLISGCQDNQNSADGAFNGLFTSNLLRVWNNGNFQGNYKKFYKNILRLMPPTQTPNYLSIGKKNEMFDSQKPFTI